MACDFIALHDIADELNNHLSCVKRVFIKNSDTETALTQLAYGFMKAGESSGFHKHDTMDEYFFFIKGKGVCNLGGLEISISPSFFLRIPAATLHNVTQTGIQTLEFVYFGIAI